MVIIVIFRGTLVLREHPASKLGDLPTHWILGEIHPGQAAASQRSNDAEFRSLIAAHSHHHRVTTTQPEAMGLCHFNCCQCKWEWDNYNKASEAASAEFYHRPHSLTHTADHWHNPRTSLSFCSDPDWQCVLGREQSSHLIGSSNARQFNLLISFGLSI